MRLFSIILILISITITVPRNFSEAQTVEELETKIEAQKTEIKKIEAEILLQEQKVYAARGERQTVESVVTELNEQRKKILADVRETESQIERSVLTIEKLDIEITDKEQRIINSKKILAENILLLDELEKTPLIEVLLTYKSLAEFWIQISERESFADSIKSSVRDLEGFKEELSEKQNEFEDVIDELEKFHVELSGEQEAVETTKKQKDELLKLAKNKEYTYQEILAQKKSQKEALEQIINNYESQLKIILDKSAFSAAESGILAWPIERRPVVITQNFGGTQFAKNNPQVYGRPFHNGTDIDLETGDKVLASLGGTVRATGNTDEFPGCYSWGKWVLIDHINGLTSLSAHLSAITVTPGQTVNTGQQIGLGGNTGYSTGSHLHFTLYATQGVSVKQFNEFKASTSCGNATTPVAAHDAYLDPMQYLPKL